MKNTLQEKSLKLLCPFVLAISVATGMAGPTNETTNAPAHSQAYAPDPASNKVTKTGEWKDPDKVLPSVNYDNVPLNEVAYNLKIEFKNEFDVLLPNAANDNRNWDNTRMALQLKDVKASEIFNAMNLVFETSRTPMRWELMMNGRRPTALLRELNEPQSDIVDPTTGLPVTFKSPPKKKPVVFFVGDLIDDSKTKHMAQLGQTHMQQLVQTLLDVRSFASLSYDIRAHDQAQLIIVRGTEDEIKFVQSTLAALREKSRLEADRQTQAQPKTAESKPKRNETTPP